jgi:hypothetical protein
MTLGWHSYQTFFVVQVAKTTFITKKGSSVFCCAFGAAETEKKLANVPK